MLVYIKSQISSLIASIFDFAITLGLKELNIIGTLFAGITGTICGGIINFITNRNIVFSSTNENIKNQIYKYFLVWIGYLCFSSILFYFLTYYCKLNYVLSKLITALSLGLTYSYLLQKHFVFKQGKFNTNALR